MATQVQDAEVEFRTLLEDFAHWLQVLAGAFAAIYACVALWSGDARVWLGVALVVWVAVVAWLSLQYARRGQVQRAASALGYSLLAVAAVGGLLAPYTFPTLVVLPIMGFAVVLPYLALRHLKSFLAASLMVMVMVIALGVLLPVPTRVEPWLTHVLLIVTTTAAAYLAMRLLFHYGSRLRDSVDRATGANAELTRTIEALRVSEDRAMTLARTVEDASRAKDDFLATVSHELRTPLTSIGGWTQLLRAGKLGPKDATHAIEVIDRNSRTLARLVDDVLDVSRIISGRLRLEVCSVDVNATIIQAAESVRPAAEAKGLRFRIDNHADGPDGETPVVNGDPARLQQVIWNLLSNSIKFTNDGGTVTLTTRRAGRRLVIEVADTGAGIAPSSLPHLFERFWQADPTTTRRQGGLGLGLAIVRHLVELHGGTVTARSAGLGNGSTFEVELPLGVPFSLQASPSLRDLGPATSLSGLQILVVDDEADSRELICSVITRWGGRVKSAASAREALESLSAEPADILVCDIAMPEEDGLSLIGKIRQGGSQVPALAITALADPANRSIAFDAGFDAYLSKPIDNRELVNVVTQLSRLPEAIPRPVRR